METTTATADRDRLIPEAYALAETLIAFGESLPPAARTVPRTPEGWALKDHLLHLAAWTRWANGKLRGEPAAQDLGMTDDEFEALFPQYDAINARFHARFRDETWDAGVAALRTETDRLVTVLQQATPERLVAPALWANTLNEVFHDFAIHHVGEHLAWMQEQAATSG